MPIIGRRFIAGAFSRPNNERIAFGRIKIGWQVNGILQYLSIIEPEALEFSVGELVLCVGLGQQGQTQKGGEAKF